jgi:hypothetical protein
MTPSEEGLREPGVGPVATDADDRSQLDWEARAGRPAATAAFGAALLPLVGTVITATSIGDTGGEASEFLAAVDDATAGVLAGAVVAALGTLLLPVALGYLYRATRARRPEAPSFAAPLLLAASVGLAVILVLQQLFTLDVASDFVAGADQSEAAADDRLDGSAVSTTTFVDAGLRVALGAAIILVALNAMRAGLLGRFMGIIGIGVGVFYAIPILVPPTLIQLFWGVALGILFLGRWPGGERGPAWSRVEAVPWPTAAERLQAQRDAHVEEAQDATRGEGGPTESAPAPRPESRKRRRGR